MLLNIISFLLIDNDIKPSTPGSTTTDESITPHISKQGSPFYAEPADSLTAVPIPRRIVTRPLETSTQSFKLVNFKLKPYREQNEGNSFYIIFVKYSLFNICCIYK